MEIKVLSKIDHVSPSRILPLACVPFERNPGFSFDRLRNRENVGKTHIGGI